MDKKKLLINIFSNWTNLVLTIAIAFIVSPIIVNKLGNEAYGLWVLIVSITGYFTVLDFGINSAIVRYISKYSALLSYRKANQVYNSSLVFFFCISLFFIVFFLIFAWFFGDLFTVSSFSSSYIHLVLLVVGIDFVINLIFGVFQGVLRGNQNFLLLNIISISINIIKNIAIVIFLLQGYSLLTIAVIQMIASVVRYSLQYLVIKMKIDFLHISITLANKKTLKTLASYSIYSFVISLALKILFYTDSVIIGYYLSVDQVTYYAIAQMIVEHLEKIVWAVIAILIPMISAMDAKGDKSKHKMMYQYGTRYSIMLIAPIVTSLFVVGNDFIALWMGEEYRDLTPKILFILIAGYIFSLSQLIAQGILKAISRHKVLAIILICEAGINLLLSVWLVSKMGLFGVALGTAIPLIVVNGIVVPYFTCKILMINYLSYLKNSILHPLLALIIPSIAAYNINISANGYFEIFSYCALIALLYWLYTFLFILNSQHKSWVYSKLTFKNLIKG